MIVPLKNCKTWALSYSGYKFAIVYFILTSLKRPYFKGWGHSMEVWWCFTGDEQVSRWQLQCIFCEQFRA